MFWTFDYSSCWYVTDSQQNCLADLGRVDLQDLDELVADHDEDPVPVQWTMLDVRLCWHQRHSLALGRLGRRPNPSPSDSATQAGPASPGERASARRIAPTRSAAARSRATLRALTTALSEDEP